MFEGEVGGRKEEGGRKKEEGGRGKKEGGRRKEKEEGRRRKEERKKEIWRGVQLLTSSVTLCNLRFQCQGLLTSNELNIGR